MKDYYYLKIQKEAQRPIVDSLALNINKTNKNSTNIAIYNNASQFVKTSCLQREDGVIEY